MRKILFLLGLLIALASPARAAGPSVLIAGYDSDNVVKFDLTTGKWTEIARLPQGSQPRGIAVGDGGKIYVGLHGGKKNLVKLEINKDSTQLTDVTEQIGRFGPGILVAGQGKIWAAGDTDRVIYRIDPATGEVAAPSHYKNCCNLVGLAASGDVLYTAEYFQRSILRYDLRAEATEGVRFINKSEYLNRPVGLAIGHNGNLTVANGLEPTIVEFDIKTGDYIRTFVNLGMGGKEGIHGILYVPETKHYYIASGSSLYEADTQGNLTASYNSPALKKAYGIALVPLSPLQSSIARAMASGASKAATASAARTSAPITHQQVTLLKLSPMTPGRLSIAGEAGKRYRVMATTDFLTWDPIGEVNNAHGEVDFVDPDADRFDRRFYRLEVIGTDK
jgi:outer membrane protein assembly factor BamB